MKGEPPQGRKRGSAEAEADPEEEPGPRRRVEIDPTDTEINTTICVHKCVDMGQVFT